MYNHRKKQKELDTAGLAEKKKKTTGESLSVPNRGAKSKTEGAGTNLGIANCSTRDLKGQVSKSVGVTWEGMGIGGPGGMQSLL